LYLGNLNAQRDWGHAREYVQAMWLMLQQPSPGDYVIATNSTHTVRSFAEKAFKVVGIVIRWEGVGVDEVGIDSATDRVLIRIDPEYYRPTEVDLLIGNAEKARLVLGWSAQTTIDELAEEMVKSDLEIFKSGKHFESND